MTAFWMIFGIIAGLAVLTLIAAYICYRMAFYSKKRVPNEGYTLPQGEIYEPYYDKMVNWIEEARAMNPKEYETVSFDGLKLCGRFYEYKKGAPIELMMHGYRGSAEGDLCGGVQRAFYLGKRVDDGAQSRCALAPLYLAYGGCGIDLRRYDNDHQQSDPSV